ncbi:hypothetical protein D6817_02235 [Candidatus Pacearchaeota archaeon]|nr:MAG: hypothetical protein D6817_02235 [Candidatus Pacearchaeota archaeon]
MAGDEDIIRKLNEFIQIIKSQFETYTGQRLSAIYRYRAVDGSERGTRGYLKCALRAHERTMQASREIGSLGIFDSGAGTHVLFFYSDPRLKKFARVALRKLSENEKAGLSVDFIEKPRVAGMSKQEYGMPLSISDFSVQLESEESIRESVRFIDDVVEECSHQLNNRLLCRLESLHFIPGKVQQRFYVVYANSKTKDGIAKEENIARIKLEHRENELTRVQAESSNQAFVRASRRMLMEQRYGVDRIEVYRTWKNGFALVAEYPSSSENP